MKWITAPLCVALLYLSGCNSDKSSPSQSTPTQPITVPVTPTPPPATTPTTSPAPTPPAPVTEPVLSSQSIPSSGAGTTASDIPGLTPLDYLTLDQPVDGDHALRI